MGRPRWLILLGLLCLGAGRPPADPCEYTQIHMGLPVRVIIYAQEEAARRAASAAFERIAALDRMMSDYRPDSELRRLELAPDAWVRVSDELFRTIDRALAIARASDGAFDPSVGPLVALWRNARKTRVPPDRKALDEARARTGWQQIQIDSSRRAVRIRAGVRLDLGGIAKGYILQEGLQALRSRGVRRALLEAGGDIVVGDAPPGRPGWHVDTPGADSSFAARASRLTNAAIATSGPTAQFLEIDGVRYSHVVDPRTGLGLTNQLLARVIATDAATADGVATALTVLGEEGVARLRARFPGIVVSLSPPIVGP
jgi:thiamine biosynthesis lipoprotein